MTPQNFEAKRARLAAAFRKKLQARPELRKKEIKLSWSSWVFGTEPLADAARRLAANGIRFIELPGDRYGADLGCRAKDVLPTLERHQLAVSGLCGMFDPEIDLSSRSGIVRQRAIDYIRRQLELAHEVGASYFLVIPGAVGRAQPVDDGEFARSAETLRIVAGDFPAAGVRAAIEPIRSAEVSIVHTIAEAKKYIAAVDHPGVRHINGDIYHMQSEEQNIAQAILEAGDRLVNLHLADSNRCALGDGSIDLDAVIMALYLLDYADGPRFATPEPLGPGGDPSPAMYGRTDPRILDKLVADTVRYWRKRERAVKSAV